MQQEEAPAAPFFLKVLKIQKTDRRGKKMEKWKKWEQALAEAVDTDYSYGLAKRMEGPKTNPVLGYRTAGSKAELETGDLLFDEMKRLGLSEVHKDRICVDSWDFHHAVLRYKDHKGKEHEFQLGAYQTEFHTDGFQEFSMVYLGRGTAKQYEDIDVAGKLVLIDINQREEWWINFPVYQAYLKGAAALIAVQDSGYGEIHDTALNAQDIAGPKEAAAFSISQADAAVLKADMALAAGNDHREYGETKVWFDACSSVLGDQETFNIVGSIPGREADSMILLSAHYDSYFTGFQDDNAAIAMMLGIAKAILKTGYKPNKTLVFCALAAEEWGVVNSKYDWSAGAYEQVFTARPEWQGKVFADLNFELPAHAHGPKDGVRCTYEYADFVEEFVKRIDNIPAAYPEGLEAVYPIQTWSDDFSMAIAGIPSMVNEFSAGEFMETHYHSQFDNEDYYQEDVFRFHHELYGRLVLAIDRAAAVPLDFGRLFQAVEASVDSDMCRRTGVSEEGLLKALSRGRKLAAELYDKVKAVNRRYGELLEMDPGDGQTEEAKSRQRNIELFCRDLNRRLLYIFRKEQDYFVRLNWHDEVLFPQEAVASNLEAIYKALDCLRQGDLQGSLNAVYEIDNNRYAFQFDREVFRYFTEYVLNQPADRLKWGAGRIIRHENLFELVTDLKNAQETAGDGETDLQNEYKRLLKVAENQEQCYRDDIRYMEAAVEKLAVLMEECLNAFDREVQLI